MYFIYFSPQGGVDADGKDDLDSGDEAEGKKIDTEEVMNKCSIAFHPDLSALTKKLT